MRVGRFRNGQWVRFPSPGGREFEDAHRNPDGWIVGVFQRAETNERPARVAIVAPDGTNLMHEGRPLVVPLEYLVDVEAADPIRDAPYSRIKHLLGV